MKYEVVAYLFIVVFCLSIFALILFVFLTPLPPTSYAIIGFSESISVSLKPENNLDYSLFIKGYNDFNLIIDLKNNKDIERIDIPSGSVVYRYGIKPGKYQVWIVTHRNFLGIRLNSDSTKFEDINVKGSR